MVGDQRRRLRGEEGNAGGGGEVIEQGEQAVDVDVHMASETRSICAMPTGPRLHLPSPAEAGHDAGRVSGDTQARTWPIMSADDQR